MTTPPPADPGAPGAPAPAPGALASAPGALAPALPAGRRRVLAVVATVVVVTVAVGATVWWTGRSTPVSGPRAAVEQLLDGVAAGDCAITHPVVTERMIGIDEETDCRMLKAEAEHREVEVTTEVTEVRMLPGGTEAEVRTTGSDPEGSVDMWFSVIQVDGRWLVDGRVFPEE